MMITNISDAKASLSKLIELVPQGQEVVIGKAGKPVARLVPYAADTAPRQLGAGNWKGKIWVADDFDDLPATTLAFDYLLELQRHRFTPLDITTERALAVEGPPPQHADPFDRMLVAQAQVGKLTLVTCDERLRDYGVPTVKA